MSVVRAQPSIAESVNRADVCRRRTAYVAIGFVLLTFALLWPTTASLMVRWEDTVHRTYTHGYLIVALTVWWIWRDRDRLVPASTFLPGIIPLFVGVLVWAIAWRAGIQIVHQAMLPALALLAVLVACGRRVASQLALPILYLYCAVPVWDAINPVLQWVSVFAVRALLLFADVPAYFEGNRIHLPAGSFEIAGGCSGLHFFLVAFSIAVLYGAINRDSLRMRVKLVALALILALLTNWIRIFIIVVAGHLSDMQHSLIRGEHYTFGWFMFAGAMVIFFLIARRWPIAQAEPSSQPSRTPTAPSLRGWLAAVLVLSVAPLWGALDQNRALGPGPHDLKRSVQGWSAQNAPSSWQPRFAGADSTQHVEYRSGEVVVESFVATYLVQAQGKEMVGYENSVLGDLAAIRVSESAAPTTWRSARGRDAAGVEWEIFYKYVVDRSSYASALRAQLAYGARSLFAAPLSSVIVLRSRCEDGCQGARSALQGFIEAGAVP